MMFQIRSVERLWELVSAYLRREEPPNSARLEYPQTHNLPAEAGFSDSTLLVKLLIEYGADPDLRENNYSGAFVEAAFYNFNEIYQYLLQFSSDENALEYSKLFLGYPSTWIVRDEEVAGWDECYGHIAILNELPEF